MAEAAISNPVSTPTIPIQPSLADVMEKLEKLEADNVKLTALVVQLGEKVAELKEFSVNSHEVLVKSMDTVNKSKAPTVGEAKKPKAKGESKGAGVRFKTRSVWFSEKYVAGSPDVAEFVAKYNSEVAALKHEQDEKASSGKGKRKNDQEKAKSVGSGLYKIVDKSGEFNKGTPLHNLYSKDQEAFKKAKDTPAQPPPPMDPFPGVQTMSTTFNPMDIAGMGLMPTVTTLLPTGPTSLGTSISGMSIFGQ